MHGNLRFACPVALMRGAHGLSNGGPPPGHAIFANEGQRLHPLSVLFLSRARLYAVPSFFQRRAFLDFAQMRALKIWRRAPPACHLLQQQRPDCGVRRRRINSPFSRCTNEVEHRERLNADQSMTRTKTIRNCATLRRRATRADSRGLSIARFASASNRIP